MIFPIPNGLPAATHRDPISWLDQVDALLRARLPNPPSVQWPLETAELWAAGHTPETALPHILRGRNMHND